MARTRPSGHIEEGFEPVGRLFASLLRSPDRGGASFVVRIQDRVLVDIWGGFADPVAARPWTRDSLGLSFSTGKGVAATVIHRLADRGLLSYDEPVAAYWPQFAASGKGAITVRQLLAHQAGLDALAPIAHGATELLDHLGAERRLAAQAPRTQPGTPAYHAITYGWLLAGLARAVTGQGMNELVQAEIGEPLAIDGLGFGRPRTGLERVPSVVGSLGRLAGLGPLGLRLLPAWIPGRSVLGALYVPGMESIFRGPVPRVLDTEMPSAGGMFTAESLAALYAALAGGGVLGGRRLLGAETARSLRRVQTRALDRNLMAPMLWRLGYHQAFIPGVRLPRAFGHYGYGGSGAWGDPDTGMSAAYVTNRVSPVTAPLGDLQIMRLSRAAVICARRVGAVGSQVDITPVTEPEVQDAA